MSDNGKKSTLTCSEDCTYFDKKAGLGNACSHPLAAVWMHTGVPGADCGAAMWIEQLTGTYRSIHLSQSRISAMLEKMHRLVLHARGAREGQQP